MIKSMNGLLFPNRVCGALLLLLAVVVPGSAAEKEGSDMREQVIIDFSAGGDRGSWRVINDGVMGGLSQSEFLSDGDSAGVFRGGVSLENNGGFASVRTVPGDYGLGEFDGISLRVIGDGKLYSFRLRTDDRFDGVAWQSIFETRADTWVTVNLPFSEFEATWRGRRVPDAPALEPGRIRQLGFLIADKQAGTFRLEVGRIAGYSEEAQAE
jgi:hypothetical protein